MGPIAPYTRLRTQAKAPNTVEMWKTKDTAIVSVIAKGQQAVMIWSPSPLVPGTGTMYLNLQWHSDWMGQVLHAPAWRTAQSLWDTVILMQLGPMQTRDTGTRTHIIKTGEKVRVLLWHIPLPLYQPTPSRTTFSGQSPMAAATLSKDQAKVEELYDHINWCKKKNLIKFNTHLQKLQKFRNQRQFPIIKRKCPM